MGRPVQLRALEDTPAHRALVQAVHEAAPDYVRRVTGHDPTDRAGDELFEARPASPSHARKHVYAVIADGHTVGVVDLLQGHPDEHTAFLGLLMLARQARGRGIGAAAVRQVERVARSWPGINRMRLGVAASNDDVGGFWRRMGFRPTGEARAMTFDLVHTTVTLWEKEL